MHSRKDLHEGRLARTVLTADGVDLVLPDVEGDVREGLDAGEGLRDVVHLEDHPAFGCLCHPAPLSDFRLRGFGAPADGRPETPMSGRIDQRPMSEAL